MTAKNYTSWNIKIKPMTLETCTSRCKKLHLKLSNLPTCSNGWNRGVAHCTKVWGPCYFSPLSGQDSLVPLELACKWDTYPVAVKCHMKPIPDEISIHKANSSWNLYQMNITSNMYQIWHILLSCTRLFLDTNKTMLKLIPDMTYTSML